VCVYFKRLSDIDIRVLARLGQATPDPLTTVHFQRRGPPRRTVQPIDMERRPHASLSRARNLSIALSAYAIAGSTLGLAILASEPRALRWIDPYAQFSQFLLVSALVAAPVAATVALALYVKTRRGQFMIQLVALVVFFASFLAFFGRGLIHL
jgi:hypothetical protein